MTQNRCLGNYMWRHMYASYLKIPAATSSLSKANLGFPLDLCKDNVDNVATTKVNQGATRLCFYDTLLCQSGCPYKRINYHS